MREWFSMIGLMGFSVFFLTLLFLLLSLGAGLFWKPGRSLPVVLVLSFVLFALGTVGTILRYDRLFEALAMGAMVDPELVHQGVKGVKIPVILGIPGSLLTLFTGLLGMAGRALFAGKKKKQEERKAAAD